MYAVSVLTDIGQQYWNNEYWNGCLCGKSMYFYNVKQHVGVLKQLSVNSNTLVQADYGLSFAKSE